MKHALWPMLLLIACDPGGPQEPEASQVSLLVHNPLAIEPDAPLRAALVWTYRDGGNTKLSTTADVNAPLSSLIPLPLRMPSVNGKLDPIESIALDYQHHYPMHRPRLVIYEDVNGNQRFDPDVFELTGPDRIRGIDLGEDGIGALLDVEALVRALPLEQVGTYYQASGGRFSPFVSVIDHEIELDLGVWNSIFSIQLDDSDFPRSSLECLRPKFGQSTLTRLHVLLDTGIAPSTCGINADDCQTSPLATLAPPSLASYESQWTLRQVSCNQIAPLEALLISRGTIVCTSCNCSGELDVTAYVANQASLPSWWPCGTSVNFCSAATSITDYERFCSTP